MKILILLLMTTMGSWGMLPKSESKATSAPEISLQTLDGQTVNLSSLKGKVVLVDFWASWCGPCRKKHPEMVALATEAADQLQIIGISIDEDQEAWKKAIREDGLPWLNLLDDEQILQDEMGIQVIPFNYLLDREGIIQAVNLNLDEIASFLDDQTPS